MKHLLIWVQLQFEVKKIGIHEIFAIRLSPVENVAVGDHEERSH